MTGNCFETLIAVKSTIQFDSRCYKQTDVLITGVPTIEQGVQLCVCNCHVIYSFDSGVIIVVFSTTNSAFVLITKVGHIIVRAQGSSLLLCHIFMPRCKGVTVDEHLCMYLRSLQAYITYVSSYIKSIRSILRLVSFPFLSKRSHTTLLSHPSEK